MARSKHLLDRQEMTDKNATPALPRLADWLRTRDRSLLRQMVGVVAQPDVLSFAGGLPDPDLFPRQLYAESIAEVLRSDARALQYGPPYQPLKEHICRLMQRRGVRCSPDQVLITTGAQQALDILSRSLLSPHGSVMLEEITYTGIQQAVASLEPKVVTVPTSISEGLDVEAVGHYLTRERAPSFLYLVPDHHNPCGTTLPAERRTTLLTWARRCQMPIIEDDPYGLLTYDGQAPPPLRSLDRDWVLYVGSFSKIVAPGLRLGWVILPESLYGRVEIAKEASDLETSALTQRAVSHFLDKIDLDAHLERLRETYGERRNALLRGLEELLPPGARWSRPRGGMFIWVELPQEYDSMELLRQSIEGEKVAFIPGQAFSAGEVKHTNCMRLSFSTLPVERIGEGLERLQRVLEASRRAA